jgi:hypothetical protein
VIWSRKWFRRRSFRLCFLWCCLSWFHRFLCFSGQSFWLWNWLSWFFCIFNGLLSQFFYRWLLNTLLFNFGSWFCDRIRSWFFNWWHLFLQCWLCILTQINLSLRFCINFFNWCFLNHCWLNCCLWQLICLFWCF